MKSIYKILAVFMCMAMLLECGGVVIAAEDTITKELICTNDIKFKYNPSNPTPANNLVYNMTDSTYLSSNWGMYLFSLVGFEIKNISADSVEKIEMGFMTRADKTYDGKIRFCAHEAIDDWNKTPEEFYDIFDVEIKKDTTINLGEADIVNGGAYTRIDVSDYVIGEIRKNKKRAVFSFLDRSQKFPEICSVEMGKGCAPKLFVTMKKDKYLLSEFNGAAASTIRDVLEECKEYLDMDYDINTPAFEDEECLNMLISSSYKTVEQIKRTIESCLEIYEIKSKRAWDDFVSGTVLCDTVAGNNFTSGYKADFDLTQKLEDSVEIDENGYINCETQTFLNRGLRTVIDDSGNVYLSIDIMSEFSDGDCMALGFGSELLGIMRENGVTYLYETIENTKKAIDTSDSYTLIIKIDDGLNVSVKAIYDGCAKEEYDVSARLLKGAYSVLTIALKGHIKLQNLNVEYCAKDYGASAADAVNDFISKKDAEESIILETVNNVTIEIGYLYNGACRKILNCVMSAYQDIVEEAQLKLLAKSIAEKIEKAMKSISYTEYLSIGEEIDELEGFSGKKELLDKYEEYTELISMETPEISDVVIQGRAIEGEELSVSYNVSDKVGNGKDEVVKWYADDAVISSENKLQIRKAYIGKEIYAEVTPRNMFDVLGAAVRSDVVYITNEKEILESIKNATYETIGDIIMAHTRDLGLSEQSKYFLMKNKNDLHYDFGGKDYASIDVAKAAINGLLEKYVPTYSLIASNNVKFKYKSKEDESTHNEVFVPGEKTYLSSNWGMYIFSIIGFDISSLELESLIDAEFAMKRQTEADGNILVKAIANVTEWDKTAAEYFDNFDLMTTKGTTKKLGIIPHAANDFTKINITDYLKDKMIENESGITIGFMDQSQAFPNFYPIESGEANAPRLIITADKITEAINAVNLADLDNIEQIISKYAQIIGIDIDGYYDGVSSQKEVLSELVGKGFSAAFEIRGAFNKAVAKAVIDDHRFTDEFSYTNKRLSDTIAVDGFSSGYKKDYELSTELEDSYSTNADGYITNGEDFAMYRGIKSPATIGEETIYCSYSIELAEDLQDNEFISIGLGDEFFGIKKENGKTHLIYNNQKGDEIQNGQSYKVLVKIDTDKMVSMKAYLSDKSEPDTWTQMGVGSERDVSIFSLLADTKAGFKYSNIVCEGCVAGYGDFAEAALAEFAASLNENDKVKMQALENFMNELDDMPDSILKELLLLRLNQFGDEITELNDKIAFIKAEKELARFVSSE